MWYVTQSLEVVCIILSSNRKVRIKRRTVTFQTPERSHTCLTSNPFA